MQGNKAVIYKDLKLNPEICEILSDTYEVNQLITAVFSIFFSKKHSLHDKCILGMDR